MLPSLIEIADFMKELSSAWPFSQKRLEFSILNGCSFLGELRGCYMDEKLIFDNNDCGLCSRTHESAQREHRVPLSTGAF